MAAPEPTPVTDGVKRMYDFLRQSEETRSKPVRTVDSAARTLWFGDLPRDTPSVASGFFDTDTAGNTNTTGTWLLVERLQRSDPPALPGLLSPWVDPEALWSREREQPPGLREEALVRVTGGAEQGGEPSARPPDGRAAALTDLHDREEVIAAHRVWAESWRAWAERERRIAPLVKLYEDLHRIRQEAVGFGESYELVLGMGLLTWTAEGHAVRRHLLTRRVVLGMDDQGRIEVTPDPDAPGFTLEEDMLEAGQRLREEPGERLRVLLERASESPGPEGVQYLHEALREWALSASAGARYEQNLQRQPANTPGETALVSFAPALVLRERPKRGQVNALREISEAVARHGAPTGLLRHIIGEGPSSEPGREGEHGEDGPRPPVPSEELYFALPSNDEQRAIADRLRDSDLVVVQGPPGTGKTHTIANLVTDLLARGQRILITSHTTRALKVLKDKLPEQIRPLAVSRTGDGVEAQRELENSVRAILERQAGNDPARANSEIAALEDRLSRARRDRDRALKDLRAIRERETHHHPRDVGDYEGTLSAIAERLAAEEPRHSWIGSVAPDQPPLGSAAALSLLHTARDYTPELRAITAEVPEAGRIPAPSAFEQALEAVARAEEAAEGAAGTWGGDLDELLRGLTREQCSRLRARLDGFTAAGVATARLDPGWDLQRGKALAGRDREIRTQAESVRTALESAERDMAEVGRALIGGLDGFGLGEALGHANDLHDGLSAGQRLHGFLGLRTALAKRNAAFLSAVTVDGRPPDSDRAARVLLHRVDAERALFEADSAMAAESGAADWENPRTRTARLSDTLADLDQLIELAAARSALIEAAVGLPQLTSLDWADGAETARVVTLLAAVEAELDAAPARELLEGARTELRQWADHSHPEPEALRRARTAVRTRDPQLYTDACTALERVRGAARLADAYDRAFAVVSDAHPSLAHAIADAPQSPVWDERLTGIEPAWAWAVWNRRLAEFTDPEAEERCRSRLKEADGEARLTMARLAAAKAWQSCLVRLTRDQEVALRSYQQSVRQLGKGTGTHAHRHRRHARESLREAQPAVPAWIMPLYQVVSTVPMDTPGVFDVVIVDEASQSGPEALLLAWLGKSLVVVGDDKQVSPANVGVDQEQVFTLQERHLGGYPASRRHLFSPNRSLFDIASGLADSRGQLMLREHFRCMPEIIGFSNENFYDGRLQPLRQYGADRLPPVKTVHVGDGMLEGRNQRQTNPAEARKLVGQIAACCADPAYEGRTMGVVTLQSGAQQTLIEDLLVERVSLEERTERRIRVGNPAAFQGDERDVMFLSVVWAPFDAEGEPRRPAPYSSQSSQQALNVAASRARDQVWLFHSFALTDLGETDLRRAYLDYLARPVHEQDGTGIGDVPADERVAPFDSLFEQRVYRALRTRGHRVRPQYPAGRYWIDLVVEGGTRRLAVECDGDAFHNEANADADAARQRELERVGWTFVRIRGSRFFRDPESALQPLWEQLERMEIKPVGL